MGLAPRYEQAPPCHRTLGSSGWKGSSPPSYSFTSGSTRVLGLGAEALGERRCNCTLPAAAAQQSHTFLQACPNTEFYLCSVRHLWSTERNWGTVHRGSEEGALQNRTPPSLPCLSISWEPRERARQKYQFLGPREKGPRGGGGSGGPTRGVSPCKTALNRKAGDWIRVPRQ